MFVKVVLVRFLQLLLYHSVKINSINLHTNSKYSNAKPWTIQIAAKQNNATGHLQ